MHKHLDAQREKPFLKGEGSHLTLELRNNHAAHKKPYSAKSVNKAQHIAVVCDAEVTAHLVALYVTRVDNDNNLHARGNVQEHSELTVRLKARQHPRCVKIVKELAAEFKVELAAEFVNSLFNLFGLFFDVQCVIKACFHLRSPPCRFFKII